MAEEMTPRKPNDEVYIKSLKLYGRVLRVGPADESVGERPYKVQITTYCRRAEVELYDPKATQEQRRASLQDKTERLEILQKGVEAVIATGGNVEPETVREYLVALEEHQKELSRYAAL